ncbi:hypothetical protein BGZ46_010583 [Entomortierella lignicola]|nr:hypothetical protein BGZ46_010583 [Entomortierella lignicola]
MTTETVIYVSLALVLLTRIYVFISPPEFLEEHKDRRYHEFHLYRQYHLHKQYDKSELDKNDDTNSLHSSSSAPNSRQHQQQRQPFDFDDDDEDTCFESLHHPSDEFILLGSEPGARPFPLSRLSSLNTLDIPTPLLPLAPLSPLPASTTPHSSSRDQGLWNRILGSTESASVPNYLELDISEIHYSGSLQEFDNDSEVQESIQGLKAGVKDMTKECPTMTMVWEGGRWCCLEGRTLYILRALEWKGQVRVRVLVDRDPMMLAVTEDDWKAAGMTYDLAPLTPLMSSTPSTAFQSPTATSPATPFTPPSSSALQQSTKGDIAVDGDDDGMAAAKKAHGNYMQMATMDTVGLSFADSDIASHEISKMDSWPTTTTTTTRLSQLTNESLSFPGSPTGHDADDEGEDDDGLSEDDERDDDDQDIEKTIESLSLDPKSSDNFSQQKNHHTARSRAKIGRRLMLSTIQSGREVSNETETLDQEEKGLFSSIGAVRQEQQPQYHYHYQQQQRRHERKISIPDFMLPPPLKDEQAYLIIDPTSPTSKAAAVMRENPFRRDSGHGETP